MNYLELIKNHSLVHHFCAIKYYQIRSDSTAVMNIFSISISVLSSKLVKQLTEIQTKKQCQVTVMMTKVIRELQALFKKTHYEINNY